jgi:integrase
MAEYAGRDSSRGQRLRWWVGQVGNVRLAELTDDHLFFALKDLADQAGRYWAGTDADGRVIYKAKKQPFAPATINRYGAALAAVCTWAIKNRIAPPGWENPFRRIQRMAENNEVVRFLTDKERGDLLEACRRSAWKKLYLFVLLALTTGARRGEIESLRWCDIDFENAVATLPHRTKNGDRRVLPLLPAVLDELHRHTGSPTVLLFASRRRPDVAYNHVPSWHQALSDAGVRHFRFHDLRHSCASYLAQSGATLLEIANVLGHRNLSVTRRYAHLTTKGKADLVHRVLGGIK